MRFGEPRAVGRPNDPIGAVLYAPAGQRLAGAGGVYNRKGCVLLWDTQSRRRVARLTLHRPTGAAVAFSADGRLLAGSAQSTDGVDVWAVATGEHVARLPVVVPPYRQSLAGFPIDETAVASLAFSPDGKRLAAGCWDLFAKVWTLDTGALVECGPPHRDNVDFVALPAPDVLLTGTAGALYRWDARTGTLQQTWKFLQSDVWSHVDLAGAGKVLSVSHHGRVRLVDPAGDAVENHSLKFKPQAFCLAWSRLDGLVGIGLSDGRVLFWSLAERAPVGSLRTGKDPVMSLSFAPDGHTLCVVRAASQDCVVTYDYEM